MIVCEFLAQLVALSDLDAADAASSLSPMLFICCLVWCDKGGGGLHGGWVGVFALGSGVLGVFFGVCVCL